MIDIYIRVIPRLCYGNRPHPISFYIHPPIFLHRWKTSGKYGHPRSIDPPSTMKIFVIAIHVFFSVDYYY